MQKNSNRKWFRESCGQVRGTDRQTAEIRGAWGLSASLGDPRPGRDHGSALGLVTQHPRPLIPDLGAGTRGHRPCSFGEGAGAPLHNGDGGSPAAGNLLAALRR